MGVPKLKTKIRVDEYLEGEELANIRHEYVAGEVYEMAGTSDRHHRISANVFKALDGHLDESPCEAFMSEMKLRIKEDAFYYPDVFVACDNEPASPYYREEPVLIIEVISPSTREIDRREKLRAYQLIPSLKEYVIIEQDKVHVEIHRRQAQGNWITYFYSKSDFDETIEFESVGMKTNLEEIYRKVKFPAPHEAISELR